MIFETDIFDKRYYRYISFNIISKIIKLTEMCLGFSLKLFLIYGRLFYSRMIANELRLTGLSPGARILHIGSGPLPYTAFYLSKKGYHVKGIDNDRRTLPFARSLLEDLGAAVQIVDMDGLYADASAFDAVWISLHVTNKMSIVERLKENINKGCFIVYREPRSWLNVLYDKTGESKEDGFVYKKCSNDFGKESIAILKI